MKLAHKICLFDSWNQSYNLGQKHCVFTPQFEPDDEWKEDHPDYEFEKDGGIKENPEFEFAAENFWEEIEAFDKKTKLDFLITGSLGLWNGRPDITPVFIGSLYDALHKCWGRCDDFTVWINNGEITCTGYHHDGRNHFTIQGFNASRMTEFQKNEYFYNFSNGDTICTEAYDALFKTDRHIRKINFLESCGFDRKWVREFAQLYLEDERKKSA